MAQYDGSIRINTELNTQNVSAQMMSLENRIIKTADKIASLRARMDSLRDAKIPTQEYKKLQNDIEKATSKLEQLKSQQASLKSSGNMFSDDWKKVSEQAQEAALNIRNIKQEMEALKSAGTAVKQVPTEEYAELSRRLESAKAQLEGFSTRQKEMKETGRDFMQGLAEQAQEASTNIQNIQKEMRSLESTGRTTTEEYTELQIHLGKWQEIQNNVASQQRAFAEEWKSLPDYIKHSTSVVRDLDQKMQALRDSGKATKTVPTEEYAQLQSQLQKWQENARAIEAEQEKLRQSGKQFTSEWNNSANKIREARAQISSISTAMKDLESKGKAFTAGSETQEYENLSQQLQYAENDLEVLNQRHDELEQRQSNNISKYVQLGNVATNALKKLSKNIYNYAIAPFISLGKIVAKTFLGIGKGAKSSNNILNKSFKNILKYGLGIRSVYILINKFRTAVKEGFKNLAQFSAPVNESLSMLKSSLTQLKNSLATAFAPILTTIAPLLKTLIDMISQAATYVGMFIATLTGASTFTKAIAVQEDYAASLNKTGSAAKKAAGALAKFDDLDVLAQPTSSGGGAGAAETPVTDMFEEVEIPDKFKDLTQWLKDMWAESDFTELGSFLGERLKESLDNIPWDDIQERARKLGASLATLINGAIETDGLGYTIGNTLAQGINTAFNYLNAFVHKLHWESIGHFIADTLNGLFEMINWPMIRDTFVTGFEGLAKSINQFIADFHWDNISDTISNLVNIISESIYTFFSTTHFDELGQKLGEQLRKSIEKIEWEDIGEAIGSVIQAALDFVTSFIGEQDFGEVAQAIYDVLKGIFETVDIGELAEVILAAFSVKLAAKATASVFNVAAGAILSGIGSALSAATSAFSSLAGAILSGISTGIAAAGGIGNLLTLDITALVAEGGFAAAGVAIGTAIIGGVIAAIGGWKLGSYIAEEWLDLDTQPFLDTMMDIKNSFTDGSWKEALDLWGNDIYDAFVTLGERQSEKFEEIKINLSEVWESMRLTALEIWENVKTGLSEKWETIKNTATTIFTTMKDSVSKIFDGLWGNIKGVINSILGGVEKMANGVVNAINTVIRALNSLSFDLPSWLPGDLGGKSLSLNISEIPNVSIPRLATGAVIRGGNPFMAILGDQPAGKMNVEAPADLIKEMARQGIREELSSMNLGGRSSGQVISLNVNGEEFARLTMGDFLQEMGRQGYDVQVLGVN